MNYQTPFYASHSTCQISSWEFSCQLSPQMFLKIWNLRICSTALPQDLRRSWAIPKHSYSCTIFFLWSLSMMAITKMPRSLVISFLQDLKTSTLELSTISVPKPCISSPLPTRRWDTFLKLDNSCSIPIKLLVLEKIWLVKPPLLTSSWDHTCPKTCMSKLDNSSSRLPSHRMFPITNTQDIYTTLEELKPSNSNILSHKQDLFKLSEEVLKSGPKLLEFKFKNFKLSLSFLWEKFQTDRSFLNLICRSHCLHISKLLTVSSLVIWKLSRKFLINTRRSSLLTRTTPWSWDLSIQFWSSVSRNWIFLTPRFPWKTSSRSWT